MKIPLKPVKRDFQVKKKLAQLFGEGPPTRPLTTFMAMTIMIGLTFLEVVLMLPVLELSDRLAQWPARASAVYVVGYMIFKLFIMLTVMATDRDQDNHSRLETNPQKKTQVQWGLEILAVVAAVLVFRTIYDMTLGVWMMAYFPQSEALEEAFDFLMKSPALAGFYILLFAPLYEEFLFRGVLLRGMKMRGYPAAVAVVMSAALFGLIHLNVLQGVHAFALGLLLGGIYLKTGSFSLILLAHILSNVVVWFQG